MVSRGEERLAWIDSNMRELQNLAGTITETVAGLQPTEIIQRQIERSALANLVALQAVKVNRDLIGSPAKTLIVGSRGTITAAAVNEGATIGLSNPTYTPYTITPSKYGVAVEVTNEILNACHFDVINGWLEEAGYAMAKAIDTAVLNTLLAPSADKGTVTASVSGVLSYDDIVAAVSNVRGNNWNPDILIVNPAQVNDLLKDTKFINASAYGDREPILNGEIGKVTGLKVLVSTQHGAGSATVLDSKHAAIAAIKRDLTVARDELPARDAIGLYVTEMIGASMINDAAQCLINSC